MSGRYARPVLCRLCGFPAPDGGIPVSQLNRRKLSEWCWRMMDTDLDEEGLEKAVFCHFCISDASFESQYSSNSGTSHSGFGLWNNIGESKLERYCCENLVQPCQVKMDILPSKQRASVNRTRHLCPFCSSSFTNMRILSKHVTECHKKVATSWCRFCEACFKSEDERQKHTELQHKRFQSCIYCNKSFNSRCRYLLHMKKNHKDEAIKYTLDRCSYYFLCEADLEKHVEMKHKPKVYCEKPFAPISLHMHDDHKKEAIRCNYMRCVSFFHTEKDKKKHLQLEHRKRKNQTRLSHKSEKTFKCKFSQICAAYFLSEQELQKHLGEEHFVKKFECFYCKKVYLKFKTLQGHIQKEHSDEKI